MHVSMLYANSELSGLVNALLEGEEVILDNKFILAAIWLLVSSMLIKPV